MKQLFCGLCLVIGLSVGISSTAHAVKYMSIGRAVKTFIPKSAKIVKVTKGITSSQRKRIDTRFPGIHHFDEIMPDQPLP